MTDVDRELESIHKDEVKTLHLEPDVVAGDVLKGWDQPSRAASNVDVSQKHSLLVIADKHTLYLVNEQVLFGGTSFFCSCP